MRVPPPTHESRRTRGAARHSLPPPPLPCVLQERDKVNQVLRQLLGGPAHGMVDDQVDEHLRKKLYKASTLYGASRCLPRLGRSGEGERRPWLRGPGVRVRWRAPAHTPAAMQEGKGGGGGGGGSAAGARQQDRGGGDRGRAARCPSLPCRSPCTCSLPVLLLAHHPCRELLLKENRILRAEVPALGPGPGVWALGLTLSGCSLHTGTHRPGRASEVPLGRGLGVWEQLVSSAAHIW